MRVRAGSVAGWLLAVALAGTAWGDDWPHFRGPARDGVYPGTDFPAAAPASRPKPLWEVKSVGRGYSSITVVGDRLYTMGHDKGQDTVWCLDAGTGATVWRHDYRCGSENSYPGPRATPTVSDGLVYTFSREGHAHCLDAATGAVKWALQLCTETGHQPPTWGLSGSVLVHGDAAYYNLGRTGVAVHRLTGKLLWPGEVGTSGYATPVLATLGGQPTLLIYSGDGLHGVDPGTGTERWALRWETSYDVNAADPIAIGDEVLLTSGYGKGAALFRLAGGKPSQVWIGDDLQARFSTPVVHAGVIYGNTEPGGGSLVALDWATGKKRWDAPLKLDFGGTVSLVGGQLYVHSGRGQVISARLDPDKYTETGRFQALGGQCWTSPAYAGGRIYLRNTVPGLLVCFDLRAP